MIDQADVALLIVITVILLASIFATHSTLRRDKWTTQKYKLFQVRDNLIYLVASGKLSEDDFVFQRFYKAINYFIEVSDHLNLGNLVAALEDARKKGLDPAEEKTRHAIRNELKKKGPEVNEVANSFYVTVLQILIENSFLLSLIMKCSSSSKALEVLFRSLKPRHTGKAALRYYGDYRAATA